MPSGGHGRGRHRARAQGLPAGRAHGHPAPRLQRLPDLRDLAQGVEADRLDDDDGALLVVRGEDSGLRAGRRRVSDEAVRSTGARGPDPAVVDSQRSLGSPMPTPAKRGKLAYTFLRAFLAVSLIPMVAAGYYLVSISEESLRQESQRIQESLAVGFADTVWNYLTTYKNILLELAHLEEFTNSNPDAAGLERQNQYLNRIMQLHAAIMEVSVLN